MSKLIITPQNVLYSSWDSDSKKNIEEEVPLDELPGYLWNEIQFKGVITLRRIFELVEVEPEFWESVIQENIEPLLEEMNTTPNTNKLPESEIECLQIYWAGECSIMEGKREFSLWGSIHGYGPYTPSENEKEMAGGEGNLPFPEGEKIGYAIEFSPVNELADYPVDLLTDLKVQEINYDDPRPHASAKIIDLGTKPFTLLEMLKSVFYELTFAGTPEERNEQWEEIKESCDEALEEIKNGTFEGAEWDLESDSKEDEVKDKVKDDLPKKLSDPLNLFGDDSSDD